MPKPKKGVIPKQLRKYLFKKKKKKERKAKRRSTEGWT